MKKSTHAYVFIISMILSACGASSGGPQTWLDSPLNGPTTLIGVFLIQVHASNPNGNSNFELFVDNVFLSTVSSSGDLKFSFKQL